MLRKEKKWGSRFYFVVLYSRNFVNLYCVLYNFFFKFVEDFRLNEKTYKNI